MEDEILEMFLESLRYSRSLSNLECSHASTYQIASKAIIDKITDVGRRLESAAFASPKTFERTFSIYSKLVLEIGRSSDIEQIRSLCKERLKDGLRLW